MSASYHVQYWPETQVRFIYLHLNSPGLKIGSHLCVLVVFTDPCYGTFKRLSVAAVCAEEPYVNLTMLDYGFQGTMDGLPMTAVLGNEPSSSVESDHVKIRSPGFVDVPNAFDIACVDWTLSIEFRQPQQSAMSETLFSDWTSQNQVFKAVIWKGGYIELKLQRSMGDATGSDPAQTLVQLYTSKPSKIAEWNTVVWTWSRSSRELTVFLNEELVGKASVRKEVTNLDLQSSQSRTFRLGLDGSLNADVRSLKLLRGVHAPSLVRCSSTSNGLFSAFLSPCPTDECCSGNSICSSDSCTSANPIVTTSTSSVHPDTYWQERSCPAGVCDWRSKNSHMAEVAMYYSFLNGVEDDSSAHVNNIDAELSGSVVWNSTEGNVHIVPSSFVKVQPVTLKMKHFTIAIQAKLSSVRALMFVSG